MKGQTSTRTKVLHALMIVILTILLLLFIAPFILVVINVFMASLWKTSRGPWTR